MAPECELRVVEKLDRAQPSLLELRRLRLVHGLSRQVGERRADPEREGTAEILGRVGRTPGSERRCRLLREPLEPAEVELRRIEGQAVARPVPLDALGAERPAQPVDVDLQRRHRGPRRLVAPERVNQPVARHDRVRIQQ